ncbi:ABC transporter ATP-binding protein [Candidatus Dependentiae bacterium]|nr:ABC transporter ATP-binding protein [Candidatus Dependentiae bacterium]
MKNKINQISLINLTKKFIQTDKELKILNNVSYTFNHNKMYAIKGISGSGKSTLLFLIAGLDKPDSGQIMYDNQDINKLKESEKNKILNQEIGLIFQYPYLIPELNVLENVVIKGLVSGKNFDECYEKGKMLLKQFNIEEKAFSSAMALSGGEQQRVALARALFNEPSFILADEPTAHLDRKNADDVINYLINYSKLHNIGLIVSSHDENIVNKMDVILELKDGGLHANETF